MAQNKEQPFHYFHRMFIVKNGGDILETGHEVYDCTNTTCPLGGSKHVWRIDIGNDSAVSGLSIERRKVPFTIMIFCFV